MTPLADILARRIAATGPMTLADYMAECLMHPDHGYYSTRDPFGRAGDFITAPEISQMFGELIGLCLAQAWMDQGAPAPFTLVELGPGRGTLMADILRATRAVPGFHAAAQVMLVEASPTLRAAQGERLGPQAVSHPETVEDLPEQPLFLVANEFFDALPIHQFHYDGTHWRERLIGLRDGVLAPGLSDPIAPPPVGPAFQNPVSGKVVESCNAARLYVGAVARRIHRHRGAALIIDYGDWRSSGDTFQALRNHRPVDPLAEPGQADLTAHVDFEALANMAALAFGYTTQGALLKALGIDHRAAALARKLDGTALESHLAAHRRLTDPAEMGSLFKVLALHRPDTPPLPGTT